MNSQYTQNRKKDKTNCNHPIWLHKQHCMWKLIIMCFFFFWGEGILHMCVVPHSHTIYMMITARCDDNLFSRDMTIMRC